MPSVLCVRTHKTSLSVPFFSTQLHMKKNSVFFSLLIVALIVTSAAFFGCKKNASISDSPTIHGAIKTRTTNRAKDQVACVSGDCVGIMCQRSTGNTCSSLSGCVIIPSACTASGDERTVLTPAQIQQAAEETTASLLAQGIIEDDQVDGSIDFIKQTLNKK